MIHIWPFGGKLFNCYILVQLIESLGLHYARCKRSKCSKKRRRGRVKHSAFMRIHSLNRMETNFFCSSAEAERADKGKIDIFASRSSNIQSSYANGIGGKEERAHDE